MKTLNWNKYVAALKLLNGNKTEIKEQYLKTATKNMTKAHEHEITKKFTWKQKKIKIKANSMH